MKDLAWQHSHDLSCKLTRGTQLSSNCVMVGCANKGPEESCRAHGDAGLLTLVVDPTPGLQLFDPCGAKWLDCADLAPLEQVLRNNIPPPFRWIEWA